MTDPRPYEPISFEQFRHLIAEKLEVDHALVVPGASFLEDLLADSIQLVDLMLQFEESNIVIPLEAAWQVKTVGDAYHIYLETVSESSTETGPASA